MSASSHGPIVIASRVGTALFVVSAAAAVVEPAARAIALAVAGVMFVAGIGLFAWAYGIAVQRSRTDAIGMGGLFFLAGDVAPSGIRRELLGALAVQTTIGVAAAAVRPYTSLAFGVLAPLYGLGLSGLWAARKGRFPARSAR